MRWFRSNIRFGSRLALFALAIQILLSFSHIDCCDLGLIAAKAAPMASSSDGSAPGKSAPVDQSDRSNRSCPICALIQLASTSTPSAAPALPLPVAVSRVRLDSAGDAASAAAPHSYFQARAPPAV